VQERRDGAAESLLATLVYTVLTNSGTWKAICLKN